MNQNTPNPRLVLRWPHPRCLTLWIGYGHYSRNNPKPRWYWTPGVAAGKEWRWEKSPLQMGIMLNSRGERMTKALEGTEVEQQTPSKWGWETSGEQAVMAFHTRSSVALGDYPRWGGWPLINLITIHNNDLIWFHSFSGSEFVTSMLLINSGFTTCKSNFSVNFVESVNKWNSYKVKACDLVKRFSNGDNYLI